MTADRPGRDGEPYTSCLASCQPCEGCGHHVPKTRKPALCEQCAAVAARPAGHDDEMRVVTEPVTPELRALARRIHGRPDAQDGRICGKANR